MRFTDQPEYMLAIPALVNGDYVHRSAYLQMLVSRVGAENHSVRD